VLTHAAARASIEEEYAKRLAKLAKMTLGRDEIGYVSALYLPDTLHPESWPLIGHHTLNDLVDVKLLQPLLVGLRIVCLGIPSLSISVPIS